MDPLPPARLAILDIFERELPASQGSSQEGPPGPSLSQRAEQQLSTADGRRRCALLSRSATTECLSR